jgi:predicted secreted hydrolase
MTIEWHFFTLSLNLECGGRVSAVLIFFRKAVGAAASSPKGTTDLDRQIFSTSFGVTVEMPGIPTTHYPFPVVTLAAVEGGVKVGNEPFHLTVGDYWTDGSTDVFPLSLHAEGPSDPLVGRPAIEIDIDCAAANPPFLQGVNGYIGDRGGGAKWYYYSWDNQPATGTVTIGGHCHTITSGLTWMDHQWGGAPVPSTPTIPGWSGLCWFEFQFDGDRALSVSVPHGPIVDGKLDPAIGIGTYVQPGSSTLIKASLVVTKYAKSPETDACYPSAWEFSISPLDGSNSIDLAVTATTVLEQQPLWQDGLTEFAEAASTVKAAGCVNDKQVAMEGVGYCEGVGFEDPTEVDTRRRTWLRSALQ